MIITQLLKMLLIYTILDLNPLILHLNTFEMKLLLVDRKLLGEKRRVVYTLGQKLINAIEILKIIS